MAHNQPTVPDVDAVSEPEPDRRSKPVLVQLKMDDVAITLGNKGVLLKVSSNDGKHLGDLRVGKATVEWMKGRTREGNGVRVKLEDLVKLIEDLA
jgi:hypothetical protein